MIIFPSRIVRRIIATKLKPHVGICKRHESKRGINRGGERKVGHNGAWNEECGAFNLSSRRYDDLYSHLYTNVCGKRQRRRSKTIDKSIRGVEQSASAQAERAVPRLHSGNLVRSFAANASFFLSLLLPFLLSPLPLMEKKRERKKTTTARGRGRRAYTRASHGTRINYNRLNATRVLACDACKRRPCARSFRYIRLGRFEYFLNTFPYFYGWTSL